MNKHDYINILKSFSLFKEFDDNLLKTISNYIEIEKIESGTDIITQGALGDKIYFIVSGTAEAYVIDKSGQDSVIGRLEQNNYFGEMSILTDGPRSCSVRAVTTCELISLERKYFYDVTKKSLSALNAINVTLSERLNQTINKISHNENCFIIMIYSDDSLDRFMKFKEYFLKITSKKVVCLKSDITLSELNKSLHTHHHSHLIIETKTEVLNEIHIKANYIINFVNKQPNQSTLLADCSIWHIEHLARVINNKTVGIALCSGGAPGAAHLGVLKVLQDNRIGIDYIAGTSAGAFYGACYTCGYSMDDVLQYVLNGINTSHKLSSYLKYISLSFTGILKRKMLAEFIYNIFGARRIEDALIPYTAIASDLYTGKSVVIDSGSIAEAVLLSGSPPILFEPYITDNAFIVDGVLTEPLPTQVLIDKKIDIKICVPIPQLNLNVQMRRDTKMLGIYLRSRSVMAEQLTHLSLEQADVIIKPNVSDIYLTDWDSIHKVVEEGEHAANNALKRIFYLLTSTEDGR